MRSLRAALRFSSRLKEHLFSLPTRSFEASKRNGRAHGNGGRIDRVFTSFSLSLAFDLGGVDVRVHLFFFFS